ncbi:MAG: hypothetical protein LBI49_23810, partial [Nocardiopsaceae bacterium]|nr:hypothetical protein [Nocardiopsaceae bacterium]
VTDAHIGAALDELLNTRNQLTRVLLGGRPATDHLVTGADAVIRNPAGLAGWPARRLSPARPPAGPGREGATGAAG